MQQDLFYITVNEDNLSPHDRIKLHRQPEAGKLVQSRDGAGLARGGLCLPCLPTGNSELSKESSRAYTD